MNNLSISLLVAHNQTVLADRLREIRDRIKPVADGLRGWRDAQISRNDYASFVDMKAGIDALPPPSRQMVEDTLSAMSEILDELEAHYPGLEVQHEDVSQAGEFEELVSHLRDYEERGANPPHRGRRRRSRSPDGSASRETGRPGQQADWPSRPSDDATGQAPGHRAFRDGRRFLLETDEPCHDGKACRAG
jgi:hypothetical protein